MGFRPCKTKCGTSNARTPYKEGLARASAFVHFGDQAVLTADNVHCQDAAEAPSTGNLLSSDGKRANSAQVEAKRIFRRRFERDGE